MSHYLQDLVGLAAGVPRAVQPRHRTVFEPLSPSVEAADAFDALQPPVGPRAERVDPKAGRATPAAPAQPDESRSDRVTGLTGESGESPETEELLVPFTLGHTGHQGQASPLARWEGAVSAGAESPLPKASKRGPSTKAETEAAGVFHAAVSNAPVRPRPLSPMRPAAPPVTPTLRRLEPTASRESSVPAPVVHVTIGRVEVRAASAAPRPAPDKKPPAPGLPLDQYLRRRQGSSS